MIFDQEAFVEPRLVAAMLGELRHRGPDDEGVYLGPQIALGHSRLSIIDLNTGHQPLSNEDGSVWVVFNGEIYNYRELRTFLIAKGHVFQTETDTEVIVHLYEEYGSAFVEQLRGMFAIALYDANKRALLLFRDRVGIKPLYYYLTDKFLVFASEIKAILADPAVKRELAAPMIDRFLTFFYMPGEETLLKNIHKLAPASYLVVRNGKAQVHQYWHLSFAGGKGTPRGLEAAKHNLLELLDETVRLHMISDVPVGFLLSGGVDSTALLSFAVGATHRQISSFTVGFSEPGIDDERPYARLAAQTFGTRHFEMTLTARDFADFLPTYVWHMEEPVCEPPAIALYYVSRLAKSHVKVLISGEGGDEAFAGYSNYRNLVWLERLKKCCGPLSRIMGNAATSVNYILNSAVVRKYAPLMGIPIESYYYSRTSTPFQFFNQHYQEFYTSDFSESVSKALSIEGVRRYLADDTVPDTLSKMLNLDTKTWLPDDLLVKADKMTMANSIELRVPFLDHKVLEFAAGLPTNFKLRRFTGKYIAKKALHERIPSAIVNRKKAGFPVPYESWMRNDLRPWVRQILLDNRTLERGYFQKGRVEALIARDCNSRGYSKEIFSLIVLELWHRAFLDGDRSPAPNHGMPPEAVREIGSARPVPST